METGNRKAFLDMIAFSEGTAYLGDNGYNVLVGGGLFDGYADHPRRLITLNSKGLKSTAAGRYQLLSRYFDHYKALLHLADFGPDSQDKIAIQQVRECRALDDVDAGRLEMAIKKCRNIWASFPGAGYGQHEQKLADLGNAYLKAGGTIKIEGAA
jgi:muramidase (phage lysozyme)